MQINQLFLGDLGTVLKQNAYYFLYIHSEKKVHGNGKKSYKKNTSKKYQYEENQFFYQVFLP